MAVRPVDVELCERLNTHSAGARIFSVSFNNEYRRFSNFARELSTNKLSYRNTNKDWVQIGSISASISLINAGIAALAVSGLISGFVPLAIGFGVTLLGVTVNIIASKHRNSQTMKGYQRTVDFIDSQYNHENAQAIKAKIMRRFSNFLNNCSISEARSFSSNIHHTIANVITQGCVKNADDLLSPNMMSLYEQHIPVKREVSYQQMSLFSRLKITIATFGLFHTSKPKESYHGEIPRVPVSIRP